jgi:GNAT superfamily N-acetyltransferase
LIIVAYVDDQPAGYTVGYDKFEDGSFYCWMAGVNPKFRKLGLLKSLMDYEDKWAKEKGYNKIKIKTRNNRREMLSYLVKYGFFFTEVIQQHNIDDNRILLEKEL